MNRSAPAQPSLDDLLRDPGRVHELPATVAQELLGRLAGLLELLRLRLLQPPPPSGPETDRLLTVEEAAERLGVSPRWLYRHAGRLPFARRLSRKALRFSEVGLRRWQAARRA